MKRLAIFAAALVIVLRGSAEAQSGTISGVVTDKNSGGGLPAVVAVYSWNGALLQSVSTVAATGAYAVNGLPAGTYFARTTVSSALNYVDEAYRNVPCVPCGITTTTPIKVASGATVTVDFPLSHGGSITGTVRDNANGTIASVPIQVAASSGAVVKATATDGSGVWTVTGLPPGTYFARTAFFNSGNFPDQAYKDIPCAASCPPINLTNPIVVVGSGTTAGIDFSLPLGGSISGVVTNSVTASPVAGVTIRIVDSANVVVKEASTNGNGVYLVPGLASGTYHARTKVPETVNLVDEAYDNFACAPCTTPLTSTTPITVVDGSTTGNINFALSPGGSIAGRVTEEATGTPLAGVTVSIRGTTLQVEKTAISDATGAYVADGLSPGTFYAFTSVAPDRNYVNESFDNQTCSGVCVLGTPITVSGTVTTSSVDFALAAGGTITGIVTDARTGAPAPGVTVEIYTVMWSIHGVLSEVSWKTAVTGPDGNYTVTGLPPTSAGAISEYLARVRPSGTQLGAEYPNSIPLAAGQTKSGVDFALFPTGDADIVADFGDGNGLWMLGSDNHWQQLHWMSAVAMIRADVDGDHDDDLIVNFGPSLGVWAWMNHAAWRFIHPGSPTQMTAADLDRNGHDDLVMVFPGYGVWRWVDTDVWTQLTWIDASLIAGNGDSLVVNFTDYGLWTYSLATGWRSLHPFSATTLVVANVINSFTGAGVNTTTNDVVVGFPTYGLWAFVDQTFWTQLHPLAPTLTAAAGTALLADFGQPYGIWKYDFAWSPIQGMSAQGIALTDRTADGQDDIILDFKDGNGLWEMRNANPNAFHQLHVVSPKSVVTGRFH